MRRFGLIGKNISYSFSRNYFKNKFESAQIDDATYENFDIEDIEAFDIKLKQLPNIKGFNVTIPYKEAIIPYLDKLHKTAQAIGAVNTIKINKKGQCVGYNTDYYGFKKALKPHLESHHKKALILGTGGASKAIAYVLKSLNIRYDFVSRSAAEGVHFTYDMLSVEDIKDHTIIINCTPLGTFPEIDRCPTIPYQGISNKHILFDLIYNPEQTKFLKYGHDKGAITINGHKMLAFQAEKAWRIWNK
ncbi:shikimate dehydrogenase [Lacinutrix sp. Hel_I_90]|uniref:shikimate dehydrogenase family protein n=1 Tax=Lacinutrix sp. Hel_I_90 TaxID=1249999 RepID=UPI0005CA7B70|nr:shikimate dehydrogenase [Lacinutrix sp. Hel_I_90]